jgi:hypothetical protein
MRACLLARWRKGYAAVCNTVYAGSIPARASSSFTTRICLPQLLAARRSRFVILQKQLLSSAV